MEYFKLESECAEKKDDSDSEKQYQQILRLWGEPTVNEKGETVYRMPPQEVLDLLVNPTRENAEKYLRWNEKKLESIQKAQKVVDEVAGNNAPALSLSIKDVKKVHFFFSPTCPYSVMQAPIIAQIAKHIGRDKVIGYPVAGDVTSIKDFMQKTGLNISLAHIDTAPEKNIVSVPVTIIQTNSGQMRRYDGFTQTFDIEGIPVSVNTQQQKSAIGGT